jgi:hypothetical protein
MLRADLLAVIVRGSHKYGRVPDFGIYPDAVHAKGHFPGKPSTKDTGFHPQVTAEDSNWELVSCWLCPQATRLVQSWVARG